MDEAAEVILEGVLSSLENKSEIISKLIKALELQKDTMALMDKRLKQHDAAILSNAFTLSTITKSNN